MNMQTVKPRARLVRLPLQSWGVKALGMKSAPFWRVWFPDQPTGFISTCLKSALQGAYEKRLHDQCVTVLK